MNERRPPLLAFTDFERALLRSAEEDEAPSGAAARALLALGVSTSHAAISQNAGGASSSGHGSGAAWSLWQKPLLIGVLGGVGVALSVRMIDGPPPRAVPAVSQVPVAAHSAIAAAPSPPAMRPRLTPQIEAPERKSSPRKATTLPLAAPTSAVEVDEVTRAEPSRLALSEPRPAPIPDTAPPAAAAIAGDGAEHPGAARSSSIAAEVMVVDRARAALRDGNARQALTELAHYREQWPLGVLTPEVTVLQIEAELRLGARDSARRRARDLVATQPNSRYTARLRTLFDESELR